MHNAFCQCVCFFTCNDRDYGKYGEREELFLRYAGLHFCFFSSDDAMTAVCLYILLLWLLLAAIVGHTRKKVGSGWCKFGFRVYIYKIAVPMAKHVFISSNYIILFVSCENFLLKKNRL